MAPATPEPRVGIRIRRGAAPASPLSSTCYCRHCDIIVAFEGSDAGHLCCPVCGHQNGQ